MPHWVQFSLLLTNNNNTMTPDFPAPIPAHSPTAPDLLREALATLSERGTEYDPTAAAGERSIPAVVRAFEQLTGHSLANHEGWLFMLVLKYVRHRQSPKKKDTIVDFIAYVALYGEEVLKESNKTPQ